MGYKNFNRTEARQRKHRSVRKKIVGTAGRPRLVVFKSARNIYAQLIDDSAQKTLTGVSSLNTELRLTVAKANSKTAVAAIVGKAIGEKAKALKIESVVFDRGGYIYHGRVKALADGARESGLKF